MRAAVLRTLGSAPSYDEHPDPGPRPGHSVVRVTAAPVVPLDLLCASGTSYFGAPAVPYVPGVQGVGVVQESEVYEPGTRVWFASSAGMAPGDGSLADLAAVAQDDLVPLDPAVDGAADDGAAEGAAGDAALAALGLSAVAAWMSLTWRARLQEGETVLVLGGGGAVGQSAIGAARILGASRVVAACRSVQAAERAEAAGADEVVLTSEGEALVERLRTACSGPVDVVVDPVFGATAEAASAVLAEGGRLVNLGGSAGDVASFSSAALRSRSVAILGYTNNALTVEQRRLAVTEISRHAADGRLGVRHEVHPLSAVADVWTSQAAGGTGSRFVLAP